VAHYLGAVIKWVGPGEYREVTARIRVVRSACGAEGLQDPFGRLLKSAREGEVLRIWSVGSDGVDQGGKGPADIVLEVKR